MGHQFIKCKKLFLVTLAVNNMYELANKEFDFDFVQDNAVFIHEFTSNAVFLYDFFL